MVDVLNRLLAVTTKIKAGFAGFDLAVTHGGRQINPTAVHDRIRPTQTGHGRFPFDVLIFFGVPFKREVCVFRDTSGGVTAKGRPIFSGCRLAKRQAKRGRDC